MAGPDASSARILRLDEIEVVDRGAGVKTLPLVGKWSFADNQLTTGITAFTPGTGIPLHSHNTEETVLLLEGEARVVIGDQVYELKAGDATWVPSGVPHYFANRGAGEMRIYWVYAGRDITRTISATGVTVEHLSEQDRVATRSPNL